MLRLRAMPDELMDTAADGSLPEELLGLTERERRFSEAYFELALERGTDFGLAGVAYRRAFPLSEADDQAASRMGSYLLRQPRVVFLVSLLRARLSERAVAPAGRVTAEIERIAFSNMLDYVEVDGDGQAVVNLRRLTPATAAAISEVDTTERTLQDGTVLRRTKIKLVGKMDALDKLVRIHGLYQDRLQVNLTTDDVDQAIAEMRRKLEQRRLEAPVIEHEAAD